MKIAYLTHTSFPSRKAHSIHVMKMCSALSENGHEVTLWYLGANEVMTDKLSAGYLFGFYGVRSPFRLRRVPRLAGRAGLYVSAGLMALRVAFDRPDAVISRFLIGTVALSQVSRAPSLLELHQPVSPESRLLFWLFRRFLRSRAFHRVIVITEPLKDFFMADHPLNGEDVLVLPDGADPQSTTGVQMPNERMQVGYFGHLYPGRGIEIIHGMARACPWADFHIVGGQEVDIERVREDSAGLGNLSIHGFVSPEEAGIWRMKMDVLVSPYQRKVGIGGDFTTEKWMSPLKVFEYMASGKPIICSDIPVLREVLMPGENCLMCTPDRIDEWVASLERLKNNPSLARKLADRALADVTTKFLWTVRAERMLHEGMRTPVL